MPRTAKPINLPEQSLLDQITTDIEQQGWETVRDEIAQVYRQRLAKIKLESHNLTESELKKRRFKKLSRSELVTLALAFLYHLIELNQQGQDTEEVIRLFAIAETTFLEKGYPPETIAKNHHPLYINILRDAVNLGKLPLNEHNSYYLEVPDAETGELIEIQQHYAQLYLKYDPQFYVLLKRKTTQNNNLKQLEPQPINLPAYLEKTRQLLASDNYTELAAGIAAASGRRFSEIIERGHPSLPDHPTSPYQFLFSGQLKKSQDTQPYLTYSLLPAEEVIQAIALLRNIPKIKSLTGATIQKLNSLNPAINFQVKKHFQDTGIIQVLPGEASVSIQNLRGAYGEIATHFFCPNRASFPRFLSASLGHLIGDETQTHALSSSTQHYFHYFLTDENGHQIDSMGVKLHEPLDDSALSSSSSSMAQRTILHLHRTTLHLFKSFQGENMSENETLIHLIDQAQLVSQLQQQLHQAQQQIQALKSQLASTTTPETPTPEIPSSSTTVTTDETPQPLPNNNTHPMDAVMLLVNSMSQLTHKMDLLLDRTISTDAPQTTTAPRSSKPKPIGSIRALKEKQNIADLHRVIDLLIQHNNSTEPERDRWFISKNILKQVVATQQER